MIRKKQDTIFNSKDNFIFMYKKEVVKKSGTIGLIANVILAIFAFAFLMNISTPVVNAQGEQHPGGNIGTLVGTATIGSGADDLTIFGPRTPPISSTPASGEELGTLDKIRKYLFSDPKDGGTTFFKNNPAAAGVLQGVAWAGIAYVAVGFIGGMFGLQETTTKALQYSLSAGLFTAGTLRGLGTNGGIFAQGNSLGFLGAHPFATGLAVGAIVFLLTYKKQEYKVINFQCLPWEAPVGGNACEKCNDGIHPCSEYRCKSLGQACDIVNKGTEEELCVWVNPRDVDSALIQPWDEILTNEFIYTKTQSRPPAWGTEIAPKGNTNGCIPAFTPITFGIQTNKPTQCKIDFTIKETYDEMEFYLGESNLFAYNHSQSMNLPNPRAIADFAAAQNQDETGGLEIQNDNTYNLYIRCSTANGFYNEDPYLVRFCVDDGPDATPPKIEKTSIRNNQPVQYNVDSVPIEVYTNEVASCKWSKLDQSYNDMENTMECSNNIMDMNKDMLYTCRTNLTGIVDRENNDFYFRCEDQPYKPKEERNIMTQSYKLTLKGTEPLNIKSGSVKPEMNEIVEGATSVVPVFLEVETENGYNKGEAECFYSLGNEENYVSFFETNSHKHKQRQDLPAGTYTYYYQCVDLGGNSAKTNTTFTVKVDVEAPNVVRILKEGSNLKLITDEDAVCRYTNDANVQCNFDLSENDGSAMQHPSQSEENVHLTAWDTEKTYYVKCKDENNRQPNPTECSIVVRPVNSGEE